MKNSLLSFLSILVSFTGITQVNDARSEQVLPKELLNAYYRVIPSGITTSGIQNNKMWWLDTKYDDFNCCSYQSKILSWLDGVRFGNNMEIRQQLEQFDYGPIQANSVSTPGHQSVVIYPKNTNWKETGIVLDPWPEQKAKTYTIQEWKKLFPLAVNPSGYYTGQYPNCGSVGYPDPKTVVLTEEENDWVKELPSKRKLVYKNIKDPCERNKRIKIDYVNRLYDVRVMADCPLVLYVIDKEGRISGFPGGELKTEIPGVLVKTFALPDGTNWSELAYSSNKGYTVILKGTGKGPGTIYSGFNMQDDPMYRAVYKYSIEVSAEKSYALHQNRENDALEMIGASKREQSVMHGSSITDMNEDVMGTVTWKEELIFDNVNNTVAPGRAVSETEFFLEQKTMITKIQNCHNFIYGSSPGSIAIVDTKGKRYGPWQAIGVVRGADFSNAYWEVSPNIVLPPGQYTVIDSDPTSWSANAQSGGKGFTSVWGLIYY
jgi:hypothetical protein